ncbi:MAG: MoaD/ThiS family protein [Candidatus Tumulicola sp.]
MLSFAALREVLGSDLTIDVPDGATVGDAWSTLKSAFPALNEVAASVRIAHNGRIAAYGDRLAGNDELALLPSVGGG